MGKKYIVDEFIDLINIYKLIQTFYNGRSDEKAKAVLVVNAYKDDVRSKLIRLEIMKKVNGAKMFMRPLSLFFTRFSCVHLYNCSIYSL